MLGRRGVSEIVAAMILISIVFAATFVVYVYSSGLLGSLQGAQPQQGQYTNQVTLEFYDWSAAGTGDSSLHTLKLTLRNVGSGLAGLSAFYVNGIAVSYTTGTGCAILTTTFITLAKTTTSTSFVLTVLPQNSCTVTLNWSASGSLTTITSGLAYSVKVVTKNGGVFSYSCIAGQRTGSF